MRNRAKCRLCKSVIESLTNIDYVTCNCGEIAVGSKDEFHCFANDWKNFIRIDDDGNEIIPTIKDKEAIISSKPNRKELLDGLDEFIKSFERLPTHAMTAPVTHSDLLSVLSILRGIFDSD